MDSFVNKKIEIGMSAPELKSLVANFDLVANFTYVDLSQTSIPELWAISVDTRLLWFRNIDLQISNTFHKKLPFLVIAL